MPVLDKVEGKMKGCQEGGLVGIVSRGPRGILPRKTKPSLMPTSPLVLMLAAVNGGENVWSSVDSWRPAGRLADG